MRTKIIVLVLSVLSVAGFAQNDSISTPKPQDFRDLGTDGLAMRLGGGYFIPQGRLNEYFGAAPMFELALDFKLSDKKNFEVAAQFVIPNQKEDFLYVRTIDTVQAHSTFMFNFMGRFKKNLLVTTPSRIMLNLGVGVSTIITDARNPFYSGQEGEHKYESVSALLLQPGLAFEHKFSKNVTLLLGIDLQYAPYKIEGALQEDIGTLAYIPKLLITF